jgi:hypothetical protein
MPSSVICLISNIHHNGLLFKILNNFTEDILRRSRKLEFPYGHFWLFLVPIQDGGSCGAQPHVTAQTYHLQDQEGV